MKSLHSGIWLPFMHLADWDCVIIPISGRLQRHSYTRGMTESCMRASWKEFVRKIRRMERDMSQRDIWPTKILLIWKEEEKNLICFLFFWIVPSLRLFIGQLDIFHMLHTCTEKEKNTKGHRSLAGKRWKKSSISPKRTLPTHNRKWDTLYYRVPKYHFLLTALLRRTLLHSVSLCFLLLKRDLKIGPTRLKRKKVQDLVWLQ